MLAARFDNLPSKPLRNFDCFGDAAAFRYQPRNVRACAEVAAFFKRLDSDADCNFFNFRDALAASSSPLRVILTRICPSPPSTAAPRTTTSNTPSNAAQRLANCRRLHAVLNPTAPTRLRR